MAHTERYETVITLNTEQAKKEIDALDTKIADLRKKQQGYAPDSKQFKKLGNEISKNVEKLKMMKNRMDSVNDALRNMSTAKPKQLKDTIKDINALLNGNRIKRGGDDWKRLTSALKEANTQLANIKNEAKVSQPVLGRLFKFLNDSWGGLTIAFQSITGISQSIRNTVQDFATMEEAMADTRKYTGLADDAVRDLNDDLKKMDTRTSREELNALAGAAGRLGKTSKKDILDFVEAGNMIKVALGDDLGDDAIDKVGKLAMAFGEDETMGLRGAMLATGSAVNELSQNSSAQAGYLVDFTARVAGFGKQLGLTQAQIMGFGAVMDENLLRDEMAATAFGNMLTKMQTDTAKFAKIAGMDFEKFSKLLKEDANGAILALADNLKRADPQTMMKMLDDMGLDGSRAVGVLSTLADKIDDVRARQELATKAYEEGTSVLSEYYVKNNTVQAEIDKAKKRFHEMSIELGERLVPVVKYTLSTTSMLTKGLSAFTKFVFGNIGAITKLTVVLLEYVAVQKIHWLWTKRHIVVETASVALRKANATATAATVFAEKALTVAKMAQNGVISKTVALQWLLNKAWKASPIGWVTAGIVLLTGACVKLYDAMSNTNKQQKIGSELTETAIERAAEEKTKISELVRTARNQNEQLDKRKKAVEELNAIIPGYNGQLDETTGKYNENSEALRTYNNLLLEKYRLEAAEEKIKEIERNKFKEELEYEETMRRLQKENQGGSSFISRWVATQGRQAEGSNSNKGYQEQVTRDHKKKMAQYQEELSIVQGIRDNTKEIVDFNRTLTQTMEDQRKVLEGEKPKGDTPQNPGSPTYTPSPKGGGGGKTEDPYGSSLQALKENRKQQLLELRMSHEAMAMSDDEFYKRSFEGEMQYHQQVLELQEKYGKSTVDTQNSILDTIAKEATRKQREQHDRMQSELDMADSTYRADQASLKKMYLDGELRTEEEYNRKKEEAEIDYLQQRLAIIQKYGGDTQQADSDLLQKQIEEFVKGKEERLSAFNKAFKEADSFEEQAAINEAMYAQDLISFEEYQNRKLEIAQEASDRQKEIYGMLYQELGATIQSAGALFSAMQTAEIGEVEKRYDKQIQAAQKAGRSTTALEKKKEKEVAAIKSKYADREFAMKVLEITADTAVGIAKLWKNPGYPWAIPLTALVAAQGAMQLAVAKQAQQNAKKGYYEGGFTGGKRYRREAGVVHEGEFVANHRAVNNPNVLPFLNFLDQAQRNNTIGHLTQEDISRQLGNGGTMVTPIVNVSTDNEEMRQAVESLKGAADGISARFSEPIPCYVVMDGPNGLYIQMKHYEKLKNI